MKQKCINPDGSHCEHATIYVIQDTRRKATQGYSIHCSKGGNVKTVLSLNAKGVDCDAPREKR